MTRGSGALLPQQWRADWPARVIWASGPVACRGRKPWGRRRRGTRCARLLPKGGQPDC